MDRIIIVVLDGVGVGELPDAAAYGDSGSHTLANTAKAVGGLRLPNMARLGLGNVTPIEGVPQNPDCLGCFGKMNERSPGKDSVTGHWEMMGIVLDRPFPTYPMGFPAEIIRAFEQEIGTCTLGNYASSGTEIIAKLGDQHLKTGFPIVYTSADSVFQIAAHEDVIPVDRLYEICGIARDIFMGEHAVGRVIARPFVGESGRFRRTERRKDFPLEPPRNVLDLVTESGRSVHAIGKISEFFSSKGIRSCDITTNNADHLAALQSAIESGSHDLIFANLEDFDMLFGHRNDPKGFANALALFDSALGSILPALRTGDLLILTNDHGNDPTTPSTDHNREFAFLLAYAPGITGCNDLGIRESFADLGATVMECFGLANPHPGRSFLGELS